MPSGDSEKKVMPCWISTTRHSRTCFAGKLVNRTKSGSVNRPFKSIWRPTFYTHTNHEHPHVAHPQRLLTDTNGPKSSIKISLHRRDSEDMVCGLIVSVELRSINCFQTSNASGFLNKKLRLGRMCTVTLFCAWHEGGSQHGATPFWGCLKLLWSWVSCQQHTLPWNSFYMLE